MLSWALLLLLPASFAQEPMTFDPMPADITDAHDILLQGILIDEATFTELGQLRVLKREQELKIQAYDEYRATTQTLFDTSLLEIRTECKEGQDRLVTHYDAALTKARKKDFWQKQGFPVGVATGVVLTAVLTVAVLQVYDNGLPDSVTGN